MRVKGGHLVLTRGAALPYKVVLDYEWDQHSEHPVATIREGEAFIRMRLSPPSPEEIEKMRASHLRLVSSA